MNIIRISAVSIFAAVLTAGLFGAASPQPSKANAAKPAAAKPETRIPEIVNTDELRIQGEQRFRTNCGRCHMAPHKFPPRMMATIVRHMRVRATLTDADMRFILGYMTQ